MKPPDACNLASRGTQFRRLDPPGRAADPLILRRIGNYVSEPSVPAHVVVSAPGSILSGLTIRGSLGLLAMVRSEMMGG